MEEEKDKPIELLIESLEKTSKRYFKPHTSKIENE